MTTVDLAERRVAKFYGTVGWDTKDEITEDARRWEDLRECAREYVNLCRRRVARHIPDQGVNLLDMASGPIQYPEYAEYSKNFQKRFCVDLSANALRQAKDRIGDHGVFFEGSFFDLEFEKDFFDCSVSLHTIYHMDKNRQERAVRKLLDVTKPGKPVIIVYSNPNLLINGLGIPGRAFAAIKRLVRPRKNRADRIYFYAHPIGWWQRFNDVAEITILPWRSFSAKHQRRLFPNSPRGKRWLSSLFRLEERFPWFFARFFQYPMVILVKK